MGAVNEVFRTRRWSCARDVRQSGGRSLLRNHFVLVYKNRRLIGLQDGVKKISDTKGVWQNISYFFDWGFG